MEKFEKVINQAWENKDQINTKSDKSIINAVKQLSNLDLFSNIYILPFINKRSKFILTLYVLFPRLSFYYLSRGKLLLKKSSIQNIVSQSWFLAILFKRLNKFANVFLIEDGISTYTGRATNKNNRTFYLKIINSYKL